MSLLITDRFPEVIRHLADPALRTILLAVAAALTLRLLRVKNTSAELAVWTGVLYAALALPLLGRLLPALPVHVPPDRAMVAVKAVETNWLARNRLMERLRLGRTARALRTAQALPTEGVGAAAHSHSGPLASTTVTVGDSFDPGTAQQTIAPERELPRDASSAEPPLWPQVRSMLDPALTTGAKPRAHNPAAACALLHRARFLARTALCGTGSAAVCDAPPQKSAIPAPCSGSTGTPWRWTPTASRCWLSPNPLAYP